MKAPACVNSKAEKVAGIVVNGEPNRLGIWLRKEVSVDVYSEQRLLTWLYDTSDVPVVLWALLHVPSPKCPGTPCPHQQTLLFY